jgi:allantoin racemase
MRLLLVNPNSSTAITERLALSARNVLAPADHLTALTARDAPAAITQPHEVQAAAERVVEMASRQAHGHDAVIVGISLDCGVERLREALPGMPVLGMTESACLMACAITRRFGVLTLGQQMGPLYEAHVKAIGLHERLAGVRAPDLPQAFNLAPHACPDEILHALAQEAHLLVTQGAGSIVLAGAVLCGYAPGLQALLGMKVLDGISCAAMLARDLAQPSALISGN